MTHRQNQTRIRCSKELALLALACLAIPARSQEDMLDRVVDLDAHVVVANRQEVPISHVGSSVEALDRFELRKGQNALLLDSLRHVPGLYLRNNGSQGTVFGITVRGVSSNSPTVLLNGIDTSNASNGEIMNPGNILVSSMSRVEVLKGAQSSLYGADTLTGVISISSLDAEEQPGGRLILGYGSFDTLQYGIGHSGSQGKLSWSVDATRYDSEGYSAQDPEFGPEWADDDAHESTNLLAVFKYEFSENAGMSWASYYVDAEAEFDPGVPPIWGAPSSVNLSQSKELYSRLAVAFRPASNWKSSMGAGYSDVDYRSYAGSDYVADGDRYTIDWVNRIELGEHWNLLAGAEREIEDNRTDVGDRDNTSVYVENLIRPSESLDLTLGLRHDDNSAYGSETTYRGTVSYRIEDTDARIRGSFGTSFQAPTFFQLFNALYGNTALKPESGEAWDLGFEKSIAEGRAFLSATLFGNDIEDKIGWNGVYENISRYESEGIETQMRFLASESLHVTAAHTYSKGEEDGTLEALRVPRNIYSLNLFWRALDDRLGINLSGQHVTSQFSDGQAREDGEKQAGYTVFDLGLDYELSERQSIWARIGNVFDEEYVEVSGFQTPGANLMVGARMTF